MLNGRKYQHVLSLVKQRTELGDSAEAERAIAATLEVLGARVPDPYRVGDWLPAPLCGFFLRGAHQAVQVRSRDGLREFYEQVARVEGAPLSAAMEHAQVVCEGLAEALDPDALGVLVRHAPPELAPLLEARERAPGQPVRLHARPGSLAEGRPGSRHPLSESRASRTQWHSVAAEEDPHEEDKLSSGHPSPDEDESNLAGGAPGSGRPLSGGRG